MVRDSNSPPAAGSAPPNSAQAPARASEIAASKLPWTRGDRWIAAALGLIAAFLLTWRLDANYLWQDEAATAVMSARLLEFGKPLAYDGKNLISNDNFTSEEFTTIDQRTQDPAASVAYCLKRGDFKADTTWTYQPLGQFLATAASFGAFGRTTFAARLPFALSGIATVLLVYAFVRRWTRDPFLAGLTTAVLVFNAFWILHARQCRYYALSSLCLAVTLACYARWQWDRARFGAAAFVLAAWCWFHVDYGTLWPVVGVLFADALWHNRGRARVEPLVAGFALVAAIVPFALYYELWGRISVQSRTWAERFAANVFNLNQYIVPALIVAIAVFLLVRLRRELPAVERRLIGIACGVFLALAVWVPSVAPEGFLRYVLAAAPLGALVTAWVAVRGLARFGRTAVVAGLAVVVLTPWASNPLHAVVKPRLWTKPDGLVRAELSDMSAEIFRARPDPNRIVVEWLRAHAQPTDEILINYEDVPLMFYLPNPIRGGIAAFRAEDDARTPPRYVILRQSVPFVHWPIFRREVDRYRWKQIETRAPDVMWGNNPDPMGLFHDPARARPLIFAERVD